MGLTVCPLHIVFNSSGIERQQECLSTLDATRDATVRRHSSIKNHSHSGHRVGGVSRESALLARPALAFIDGQLAVGTCEIVMLNRDSSQPKRTIARQTARCACRRGQIAGTTRARPACVDARIVKSKQWAVAALKPSRLCPRSHPKGLEIAVRRFADIHRSDAKQESSISPHTFVSILSSRS
ncbi:chemokine-like protein TAFA-2 [Pimephales promelas]|nr:chemokine-like protein TAFA-2 [Pimephales promelas]